MVHQIKSTVEFNDIFKKDENRQQKFMVVDFFTTWCGPCKRFAPKFEELEKTYGEHILFYKIDADELEEVATAFEINVLPTFKFFNLGSIDCNDRVYKTVTGVDENSLIQIMKEICTNN